MIPLTAPVSSIFNRQWVNYPPLSRRTARQLFTFKAAELYGLVSRVNHGGGGSSSTERVEKSFHEAMQTCPLPPGSGHFGYQPKPADFFVHLTMRRLEGAPLPLPVEAFSPQHQPEPPEYSPESSDYDEP